MAKQISYTDTRGIVSAESYWIPAPSLDKVAKIARIRFSGYASETARANGSQAIAEKNYHVSGADYIAHFSPAVLDVAGTNVFKQCYIYAATVHDGDVKTGYTEEANGTYTKDLDGSVVDVNEARGTFFENAKDV